MHLFMPFGLPELVHEVADHGRVMGTQAQEFPFRAQAILFPAGERVRATLRGCCTAVRSE